MINLVVAVSDNNVIGVNNTLPWKLSADMKMFKQLTTNHTVVMGRKTFESIGKPLPNRKNIIITSNPSNIFLHGQGENNDIKDIITCSSIEEGLFTASLFSHSPEVFIIGGGQIYKEVLEKDLIDRIYLTRVHTHIEGDTFFPEIDEEKWKLINYSSFALDEKNQFDYTFETYEKNDK